MIRHTMRIVRQWYLEPRPSYSWRFAILAVIGEQGITPRAIGRYHVVPRQRATTFCEFSRPHLRLIS